MHRNAAPPAAPASPPAPWSPPRCSPRAARRGVAFATTLVSALALLAPGAHAGGPSAPDVVRLAGPDRFSTAAAVSATTFDAGVDVAYVATGEGYADALAGGPLAARHGAPILLVGRDAVPAATTQELQRLRPGRIVVFGGPAAVSEAVIEELAAIPEGGATRLAGASRFATATAISAAGFPDGADTVLVATGEGYADALAGGPVAARAAAPILLVRPDAVPEETAAELDRLGPARIDVLGGDAAISEGVLDALRAHAGDVRRLSGADRYATAVAVTGDAFEAAGRVFLATGEGFADALAGVPAAAAAEAPILLTRTACMPDVVRAEIERLAPEELVVLGGPAAVSDDAAARMTCEVVPPPTFAVDDAVQPEEERLPPLADGAPRRLVRIEDELGNGFDFVEDELLLVTDDAAALATFLERWDGTVLEEVELEGHPTTYLVRIDPNRADAATLASDVRALDPLSRGAHAASSDTALQLLAAGASEAADGATVGVNFVVRGEHHGQFIDGVSTEAPTTSAEVNAFNWTYMSNGSIQDFGVTRAWQLLEVGGRLDRDVGVMIIDGGFASSDGDFPPGVGGNGQANPINCSSGNACPWHGTQVAQTAGGSADNGWGTAGSGAPVADLSFWVNDGGALDVINGIVVATYRGIDVVNVSSSANFPAGLGWVASPLSAATLAAFLLDTLVVASAGNDGADVDDEDCLFGGCWEENLRVPCEAAQVLCVGGLAVDSLTKAPNSAFGRRSCGNPLCDVEIFGPYTVYVGSDPDAPANARRSVNGTSFSAPFVAGVAALVFAADPGLGAEDVRAILLDTANRSPDTKVSRVIDAEEAVRAALGPVGTAVDLLSPAAGLTLQYGTTSLDLRALAVDDEDGCCQFAWTSSIDGSLGIGGANTWTPGAPGSHTVTVTGTSPDGSRDSDSVVVRALNAPPSAAISVPTAGQTFLTGASYKLRGSGTDPNQSFVRCPSLRWTSSVPEDVGFGTTACQPVVSFASAGPRTITLTVTDDHGLTATRTVDVVVEDPPPEHPPFVEITSPDHGASLYVDDEHTLEAEVHQAAAGGALTVEWRSRYNGQEHILGTTNPLQWTPNQQYPNGCEAFYDNVELLFTATDELGTTTDSIVVDLQGMVC